MVVVLTGWLARGQEEHLQDKNSSNPHSSMMTQTLPLFPIEDMSLPISHPASPQTALRSTGPHLPTACITAQGFWGPASLAPALLNTNSVEADSLGPAGGFGIPLSPMLTG